MSGSYRFAIDRGGTFTDVVAETPAGELVTAKLLSSNPEHYPDAASEGYAAITRDFIDPIERAYALMLRLSTAIANQFGAHG